MASKRWKCLVALVLLALFGLYVVQVSHLVNFMAARMDSWYWVWLLFFLPASIVSMTFIFKDKGYANEDEEAWFILVLWGIYNNIAGSILLLVVAIFSKVVDKLGSRETFALKSVLCITPALLILLSQLTNSPSYRKSIMATSVLAALDIFDVIEMLEIVLMQNERKNFDLNGDLKGLIIAFACIGFFISSLGLVCNTFGENGKVKERWKTSVVFGLIEIFAINLPFLILRIIVRADYGYEASIFVAKNIISLVIGAVEIGVLIK